MNLKWLTLCIYIIITSFHKNLTNIFCWKHYKYGIRSVTNKSFYLQRQNLSYGQCSYSFNGVKIWDKIPLNLKILHHQLFVKKMKAIIVSQY